MTGTGLSQAITIVGTLILAHLFAPEAFGLLALYMTLVSFLSVLGGGRYELAIMLPETDADAANILNLSILVAFGLSLVCLVLIALFRFPIASLLGDARMTTWLWSVPAVVLVFDVYQSLYIWCSRLKQFRRLAYSRVFLGLGTVLSQLGLFALQASHSSAVGCLANSSRWSSWLRKWPPMTRASSSTPTISLPFARLSSNTKISRSTKLPIAS